jgi:hypothetical protein
MTRVSIGALRTERADLAIVWSERQRFAALRRDHDDRTRR